jgi:DNA mismatch repair ATPase MutS
VHTSIRVQDSLEQGVSFFMAELLRLKQVVDAAHAAPASGRTLLYLLDEILQGTNSAERTIAARRIVGHLVASGAIGAVTTHDLALAGSEALVRARTDVHFTEQLTRDSNGESRMTFDYRLRPGVATSTNALKLLEIVGLPGPGS